MGIFKKRVTVTKSLAMSGKETGAIIGVKGVMLGRIHRMEQGEEAIIGSDPEKATILLEASGLEELCCSIRYIPESKEYIVCNQSGVYVAADDEELENGKEYTLEPGCRIVLGKPSNEIRLG